MLCNSTGRVRKLWEKQPCRQAGQCRRWGGGASGARTEVPLQPVEKSMVTQAVSSVEDLRLQEVDMPWRKLQSVESSCQSRFSGRNCGLQWIHTGAACSWRTVPHGEDPHWSRSWRMVSHGRDPTLETGTSGWRMEWQRIVMNWPQSPFPIPTPPCEEVKLGMRVKLKRGVRGKVVGFLYFIFVFTSHHPNLFNKNGNAVQ